MLTTYSKILFSCTILVFLSMHNLNGQNTKVAGTYTAMQAGDYLKARQLIDDAIAHPSTIDKAKTWYYRGLVYEGVYFDKDKEKFADITDPLLLAAESYKKAMGLNTERIDEKDLTYRYGRLADIIFQVGVNYYNQKNFMSAKTNFEACEHIKKFSGKTDSLAIFNQALAHEKLEEYDAAIFDYQRAIDIDYNPETGYSSISFIYRKIGDDENLRLTLEKARLTYPENLSFLSAEINYFLKYEKLDKALENLNIVINMGNTSKVMYFARGTIYNSKNEIDKAIADYKTAIKMDPEYFDAVYNLGALHYNYGTDFVNKATDSSDQAVYEANKKEGETQFNLAIPYLERAYELQPDNKATIQSLLALYARMNLIDKYKAFKIKTEVGN